MGGTLQPELRKIPGVNVTFGISMDRIFNHPGVLSFPFLIARGRTPSELLN
jgi:hypothetical protein